jgi:hypothetical protein
MNQFKKFSLFFILILNFNKECIKYFFLFESFKDEIQGRISFYRKEVISRKNQNTIKKFKLNPKNWNHYGKQKYMEKKKKYKATC